MNAPGIDLAGQVAIVTGAGAGIGRGIALALARHGADIIVADIDVDRATQTTASIADLGRVAITVQTDVMETDQVMALAQRADDAFGRLDILVNNAGGVRAGRFLEQSERSWRRHIEINLVSMLAGVSAAAPVMIRGGQGGAIVNVASIEGTRAAPMYAVYGACKAAMLSFTRTMAVELAEHGIRVNAIAPDWTRTPGNSGLRSGSLPDELPPRPDPLRSRLESYVPLGREGVVDDCGNVAVFLCSDLASYVTGVTIPVDGGTWASSGWVRADGGGWSLFGPEFPMV